MPANSGESGIIVGRNPVAEALSRRGAEVEKVLIQKGRTGASLRAISSAAAQSGIPVQYVPKQRLDRLAEGTPHQGVAAVAASIAYADLDDMMTSIAATIDEVSEQAPLMLVLDRIQDPHNYGAILRSAAAAGVAGIVVPSSEMSPLSPAAVKASAGTAGRIAIARVGKLTEALTQIKERGYWVVGLSAEAKTTIWDYDWRRPVALVVGSEGEGMSRLVSDSCDDLVKIPMSSGVESLNASVAAAVALFSAMHARMAK